MSRFQAYGQSDNQWQMDGDPSFRGIDMVHDRGTLQPGYLARSENKRLRDGPAKTRLGSSMPGDFNPGFEGAITGAMVYNNPNGSEVMLVATAGTAYVWALQFGRDPVKILLESPQTLGNYTVEFCQAFEKVLLFRRPIVLPTNFGDKEIDDCTFTAGASGDITVTPAHGLAVGNLVRFTTTGTLPASINPAGQYYVLTVVSPTVFHISATTPGGTLITFATAGSGTHTVYKMTIPPVNSVPTLEWDGNFTHTFKPIALAPPGLNLVPSVWHGEPFENRVIYYAAMYSAGPWRDQVLVSDILNYTSYDPLLIFRINAGEANMITRVMAYFRSSIVIFMKQSIHMLSNFTQVDQTTLLPSLAATQQRMLSSLGSVGNKMPLQDGADVIFLSQPDGFYRLGEVIQDQIAVQPIPISRNIQPIIENIHWDRAHQVACSAGLGDYAYFALPLIGSTGANDIIAVYNRTNREWESIDSWAYPNFRIHSLHTTLYDGARQLFAVGNTGPNYNIYLLNNGLNDEVGGNSLPVEDLIETRGYTMRDPSAFKRIERAIVSLATYDPQATVTALTDGVNEEKELAPIEKDRRLSYVHGRARLEFDPGEDNETPRREDYSVIPRLDFAGEDFEDYPEGPLIFIAATPSSYNGVKQQSLERFQVRASGRWVSIRIANTSGQCDVMSVAVEGYNTQETIKVIA